MPLNWIIINEVRKQINTQTVDKKIENTSSKREDSKTKKINEQNYYLMNRKFGEKSRYETYRSDELFLDKHRRSQRHWRV